MSVHTHNNNMRPERGSTMRACLWPRITYVVVVYVHDEVVRRREVLEAVVPAEVELEEPGVAVLRRRV
jgi:hypothetical protein